MTPGAERAIARRVVTTLLPDDDWSREFIEELDHACDEGLRSGSIRWAGGWYARQLLRPSTWRLIMLNRSAARRHDRETGVGCESFEIGLDARHACRILARDRRTALLVALTLGLGIGPIAAMYGVADRLFLRGPAHVVEHEALARTYLAVDHALLGSRTTPLVPWLTATALVQEVPALRNSTRYRFAQDLARIGADVRPVRVSEVDGRYFEVLGTVPAAGRFFDDRAAVREATPIVVSHALALGAFGGAPAAVGRTVQLSGSTHTVVAVAPERFSGPHLERVDLWLPIDESRTLNRNWFLVTRLADAGAARAPVLEEAQAVHDATDPGRFFQWAVGSALLLEPVSSGDDAQPPPEAAVARLLLAVMGLVLVIAGANAMNLLLARAARRRREVVVRLALGSGRRRLARLFVAESVLLGLLGGALSMPVAYAGGRVLQDILLPQVAWATSPVDGRVILLATGVALAAAIVLGLVPAWSVDRLNLTSGLESTRVSGGRAASRAQVVLATGQVALSAVLLLCAGLFLQSFRSIRVTDLGVDAGEVLAIGLASLDVDALRAGRDDERASYERALAVVRDLDGTQRSALSVGVPFRSTFGTSVWVPGVDSIPELPGGGPYVSTVGGGYFDAVGTTIVRGRPITDQQVQEGERTVVVSETAARLLWPNLDPLGRCVRLGSESNDCSVVVGVAEDVHQNGYREPESMQFYVPLRTELGISGMTLVSRPSGDLGEAAGRIRARILQSDPAVDYVDIERLDAAIEAEVRPWRLGAVVLTVASALAAVVSLLGVYSVLSYLVTQRRKEIGVRMALGATGGAIRRQVLRTGLVSGSTGVLIGVALVLAGGRWLDPLLFETSAADPLVLTGVGTLLLSAAVAACLVPARQASRVAPVDCLKDEG